MGERGWPLKGAGLARKHQASTTLLARFTERGKYGIGAQGSCPREVKRPKTALWAAVSDLKRCDTLGQEWCQLRWSNRRTMSITVWQGSMVGRGLGALAEHCAVCVVPEAAAVSMDEVQGSPVGCLVAAQPAVRRQQVLQDKAPP